jgi:hypothetical protein
VVHLCVRQRDALERPATVDGDADTTVVTFNKGNAQGWIGPAGSGGTTSVLSTGGNPTWNMRTVFNNFGIGFFNNSNDAFIGDYTAAQSVTLKIDLKVDFLNFFGQNVSRPWLVELRNPSLATGGYPWVSVWYKFAQVSAATHGQWTTFTVTFDPRSTTLPPGWKGYGAEDPVTFEPILPAGVTFDEVLAGVTTVSFTTLEPGLFFGFTDHTFRIDNITVTRVPASVPGDLNGDGSIGAPDLSILLSAWGPCAPGAPCPADLNGDGAVGPQDLAALLAAWS